MQRVATNGEYRPDLASDTHQGGVLCRAPLAKGIFEPGTSMRVMTFRRVPAYVVVVAAWLGGGCRLTPEQLFEASPVRCYRLAVGQWKMPQPSEYPEQRVVPPTPQVLLLDPERTEWVVGMPPYEESPWRRLAGQSADTAWAVYERGLTRRRWRIRRDSLFVQFTTSSGGLGLRFRVVGDSLVGSAEVMSVVGRVAYPTAPATGVRVRCPGRYRL